LHEYPDRQGFIDALVALLDKEGLQQKNVREMFTNTPGAGSPMLSKEAMEASGLGDLYERAAGDSNREEVTLEEYLRSVGTAAGRINRLQLALILVGIARGSRTEKLLSLWAFQDQDKDGLLSKVEAEALVKAVCVGTGYNVKLEMRVHALGNVKVF